MAVPASDSQLPRQISRFLGAFRWLFMPLGLFALLAVGVHAAADTMDDRILSFVDGTDAFFDTLFARWSVTQPIVSWVGIQETTRLARALTLVWEICADLVLLRVAFGYRESDAPPPRRTPTFRPPPPTWPELLRRIPRKPTTLRLTRPLCVLPLALAGACAIARLVQGQSYLAFHGAMAGPMARLLALAALALVLASLAWRALLRTLQDADLVSQAHCTSATRSVRVGLWGTVLLAPLAAAAAVDATPLLSFFR